MTGDGGQHLSFAKLFVTPFKYCSQRDRCMEVCCPMRPALQDVCDALAARHRGTNRFEQPSIAAPQSDLIRPYSPKHRCGKHLIEKQPHFMACVAQHPMRSPSQLPFIYWFAAAPASPRKSFTPD